jgi:hypothetical protein
MNRRSFLRSLVGGVAAAAAVRTFPFRVFSFPSEVVPARFPVWLNPNALPGRIDLLTTSHWGRLEPGQAIELFGFNPTYLAGRFVIQDVDPETNTITLDSPVPLSLSRLRP